MQVSVGLRISEARKESGLTQQAFGRKVGSAARTVQTWEHGQRIPRAETMERIALLTGRPVWWFYTETDAPETAAA